MKEIKAIIQPHMLNKVMRALHALPHFPGVTISNCNGQGRGRGEQGQYIPTEYDIELHDRTRIEIFCSEDTCDELITIIQQTAHTGNAGDGIIMVADLPRVIRIRTGEEQRDAV